MHATHETVNLDTTTCPNKEERLGSINAYHGKVSELLKENETGSLPVLKRRFKQTEVCLLMQAANRIITVRDATVIVHGPIGCASGLEGYQEIYKNIPESLGRPNFNFSWVSTNLSDKDVVYGGEAKLRAAIIESYKRYSPKAIFILTTCTSGVMGDDVEGVVRSVRDEVPSTIVPIHCESFKSTICQTAFDSMAHAVVKYLIKPPEKKQKDLVAIPAPFSTTWSDRIELTRVLQKLGLRPLFFPDFATVEELERLSEAAVIAPTCMSYGDYWQKAIHQKFGVPYFRHPMPVGIKNTAIWLRQIAKYTGKEKEVEALIKEELEVLEPEMAKIREALKGKDASILIAAGQPRATFTPRLAAELGIKVSAVHTLEVDSLMIEELKEIYNDIGDFDIHASNWNPHELAHTDNKLQSSLNTVCPMMGLFRRSGGVVRNHSYRSDFSVQANQMGFRGTINYGYIMLRAVSNPSLCKRLNKHIKKPYQSWWFKGDNLEHFINDNGERLTHGPGASPARSHDHHTAAEKS
jgi:Nitrogenase molybdenum-iron protein, alpha and beta chains